MNHTNILLKRSSLSLPRLLVLLLATVLPTTLATHAHENSHSPGEVVAVVSGGAAERAGFLVGDRLLALDGSSVATSQDLEDLLVESQSGDRLLALVARGDTRLELSLALGQRPDGGVSLGLSIALPSASSGLQGDGKGGKTGASEGADVRENTDEIAAAQCLGWVQEKYPVFDLAARFDLDLALDPEELSQCVEADTQRMIDPMPLAWCDNVFKVHCGGLELLTEVGLELGLNCTAFVRERFAVQDSQTLQCLEDVAYSRFTQGGVVTEGAACSALYEQACAVEAVDQEKAPNEQARVMPQSVAGSFQTWPDEGPDELWRRPLGDGYSGIVYADGRLFTSVRDRDIEAAVALDARTGTTLWQTAIEYDEYRGQRGWGAGPRSTPLLSAGRLFTVGIEGNLTALEASNGDVIWQCQLWEEPLAGNRLSHGYSSTPLAWKDLVIVPVGGADAGVVAFKQATGEQVWASTGRANSFSSPVLVELAGSEQILIFMAEELLALEPSSGVELWRYPHVNQWRHNISQPMVVDGERLFLSSPEVGARGLRVERAASGFLVHEEWRNRRMQLYHGTSAFDGQLVYGSSGVSSPAFLTAISPEDGEIVWRVRGFSKANVLAAGNLLLVLDEDGQLALVAPAADRPKTLSTVQLFDSRAWTVPTLIGKTLFVRNTEEIVALDLGHSKAG